MSFTPFLCSGEQQGEVLQGQPGLEHGDHEQREPREPRDLHKVGQHGDHEQEVHGDHEQQVHGEQLLVQQQEHNHMTYLQQGVLSQLHRTWRKLELRELQRGQHEQRGQREQPGQDEQPGQHEQLVLEHERWGQVQLLDEQHHA